MPITRGKTLHLSMTPVGQALNLLLMDSGEFWGYWWKAWGSQGGGGLFRDWAAAGYQPV